MLEPKFSITPKLLENIKKIGVIVADLNNRHFSKLTLVKLEKLPEKFPHIPQPVSRAIPCL
jgi:hypothetical protein